jgi:hypothetical protein
MAAVVNGKPLEWASLSADAPAAGTTVLVSPTGTLLALARVEASRLRYERVFTQQP